MTKKLLTTSIHIQNLQISQIPQASISGASVRLIINLVSQNITPLLPVLFLEIIIRNPKPSLRVIHPQRLLRPLLPQRPIFPNSPLRNEVCNPLLMLLRQIRPGNTLEHTTTLSISAARQPCSRRKVSQNRSQEFKERRRGIDAVIVVVEVSAVGRRGNVEDVLPRGPEKATLAVRGGGVVGVTVEENIAYKVARAEETRAVSIYRRLRGKEGQDLLHQRFGGGILPPHQSFKLLVRGVVGDREGSDSGFPAHGGGDDLSHLGMELVGFESVREGIGEDITINDGEEAGKGTIFACFGVFGEGAGGALEDRGVGSAEAGGVGTVGQFEEGVVEDVAAGTGKLRGPAGRLDDGLYMHTVRSVIER